MFDLSSKTLKILLHDPCDGFYQGTRFDRSGIFDSLLYTPASPVNPTECCPSSVISTECSPSSVNPTECSPSSVNPTECSPSSVNPTERCPSSVNPTERCPSSVISTECSERRNPLELCGRWFSRYDPFMHDAVCGPAEEFSLMVLPDGTWLKPGVGILVPDGAPYDRFKLYEIANPGHWSVESTHDSVTFIHELPGYYVYEKTIALVSACSPDTSKLSGSAGVGQKFFDHFSGEKLLVREGQDSFEIRHKLHTFVPLEGDVYNHNFFTFGKMTSGPSRHIDLHCIPEGDWRAQYTQVGFVGEDLRFTRVLEEGESVYCGNIHEKGTPALPYCFTLRETATTPTPPAAVSAPAPTVTIAAIDTPAPTVTRPSAAISVHITGDRPASKAVFWANHRIACLEPYTPLHALTGDTLSWSLRYTIF